MSRRAPRHGASTVACTGRAQRFSSIAVRELRPGLWPVAGTPSGLEVERAWDEDVSSYAIDDDERLLLFDPLGACRARSRLSRPSARRRSCSPRRGASGTHGASSSGSACRCSRRCPIPRNTSWTRTASPPSRPATAVGDRLAPQGGKGEARPYAAGDRLPFGADVFAGHKPNDTVLWVESQHAVISGDTLVDFGQGLEINEVAPPQRDPRGDRRGVAPAARVAGRARARDARWAVRPRRPRARVVTLLDRSTVIPARSLNPLLADCGSERSRLVPLPIVALGAPGLRSARVRCRPRVRTRRASRSRRWSSSST